MGLAGLSTGRMACGWLCPFGFLQDLMFKIKSRKFSLPVYLRYGKYVVLVVLVIVIPYETGVLAFSNLCPAGTLTAGIPWVLWNPTNPATGQLVLPEGPGALFAVDLLILAGCLVWFVVSKRPFCRAICPMGAILSLFNRFSVIRLEVDRKCDGCSVCQIHCPTDLNIAMDVDSGDCIRCLECTRCGHVKLSYAFTPDRLVNSQKNKGSRICAKS